MRAWIALITWIAVSCGPTPSADDCTAGQEFCDGACVDVFENAAHCGGCGNACPAGDTCDEMMCVPPECEPGATETCYDGRDGSLGVGSCVAGERTCRDNARWSSCFGQVLPLTETCGNGVDENCNGMTDEDIDEDGDGFSTCGGDCCDLAGGECADPELVNPGAFEAVGNDVDDDCDGTRDNPLATCDDDLPSNPSGAMPYARAIDLCQEAIESEDPTERRWGVVSAELRLADGTGAPASVSHSIRAGFGDNVSPRSGNRMMVLSNGVAAAAGQTSPAHQAFQVGTNTGTVSAMPADWLSANGGTPPNAPGCPAPGGTNANDSVMLVLRVRAPTNARSFNLAINFQSSEYPEWVCSPYNDFFVVLLDSAYDGDPANPGDKNLAFYRDPAGAIYPVGVNLAFGDTGLLRYCENGTTGCASAAVSSETTTCESTLEIEGTGFDVQKGPSALGAPGWCGKNDLVGAGTGWLETAGNVVPGEIFELRIAVWDTSDPIYDSLVMVDRFEWSVEASEPGTGFVVD